MEEMEGRMNWWLDLGLVYCHELVGSYDLLSPELPKFLITKAERIGSESIKREEEKRKTKPRTKIKTSSESIKREEEKNPYFLIINKTLLNNDIINQKKKNESQKKIEELFSSCLKTGTVPCSFCDQKTTTDRENVAARKWIISGGWEESPLYAGAGLIQPRICLNCRKLSILASFKAYELFIENKIPFIIYNSDIRIYKKLLDNILLRKNLNLNFERSSSIFLSLGSILVYPKFDNRGNIANFDLRPLLPNTSLMLMNLSGLLRTKVKEQYILETVEKYRGMVGLKLISDFLKKQSKLSTSDVITAFYAFVKTYKGGVGMTRKFFELGNLLGKNLEDKAYSVALKLYKSLRDPVQLQKQLIGVYIYLKEPIPIEMTQITERDENALAFIMGIMNAINK